MRMDALSKYRPFLLSVLRIMAGLLILQHGTTKLLHFPESQMSGVSLATLPGIAGIFELVCGVLITVGFQTRLAAFLLSGLTAAAYFIAHAQSGFHPLLNGGELAVLYCFTFLYIAAAGPGPISVDAQAGRR
jgi:putative oxidoreductase